ncbi:class I SAM-dependent methyltransferase [Sorangium sp. So ce590]
MTQNIYDDPGFFEAYSQLRRSVEGLDGAPEWPALQALVPDLTGLRVVDLGCGFGWFCRWARENGAASVLGLDVSERMLQRARSETSDEAILYTPTDLERLDLPEAAFDFAYSSLALHYIEHLGGLLAAVHRALAPGERRSPPGRSSRRSASGRSSCWWPPSARRVDDLARCLRRARARKPEAVPAPPPGAAGMP